LNLRNRDVVDHLLKCVRGWIDEFGIDGLRLDVAYCLDKDFMRELRKFCDGAKPGFFLMGEMLFGDYRQIVNGGMLHSCTNYECYKGTFSSFNDKNLFEISYSLNRQFGPENWTIYKELHLFNFIDNHDVSRISSILIDKQHIPLVYGMLFGMPGIPCIYYGSEWGIEGDKKNGDDALRPVLDSPVDNELSKFVAKLISIRKNSKALNHGGYKNLLVANKQLIFERGGDGERVWVAINAEGVPSSINGNINDCDAVDLISGARARVEKGYTLPPYSVAFWKVS
jgi:glycosidase